jgi:BMFP domain-containing protein YqiC
MQHDDKNSAQGLLAQSALSKLDVVPRSEFDAQTAVLQRTRQRIEELESKLEALTQQLEGVEKGSTGQ